MVTQREKGKPLCDNAPMTKSKMRIALVKKKIKIK